MHQRRRIRHSGSGVDERFPRGLKYLQEHWLRMREDELPALLDEAPPRRRRHPCKAGEPQLMRPSKQIRAKVEDGIRLGFDERVIRNAVAKSDIVRGFGIE